MLFVGQAPKALQKLLLSIAKLAWPLLHDFPRMAAKCCRKPKQPVDRELTMAEFKLVDLLIGRAD